ncbi:hypothetical protein Nepgr_018550 [Nepenthes gracilis]|uniref:Uncharacterized protein n=1 Tax=Nepenthes gracilis TaxID=150966 RepID=A0AAD3XU46_NEPGR|nr:hypothetical protein Nepgr_018550 [Nepenthes gracilis]
MSQCPTPSAKFTGRGLGLHRRFPRPPMRRARVQGESRRGAPPVVRRLKRSVIEPPSDALPKAPAAARPANPGRDPCRETGAHDFGVVGEEMAFIDVGPRGMFLIFGRSFIRGGGRSSCGARCEAQAPESSGRPL